MKNTYRNVYQCYALGSRKPDIDLTSQILDLTRQGVKIKEIVSKLQTSRSNVNRVLRRNDVWTKVKIVEELKSDVLETWKEKPDVSYISEKLKLKRGEIISYLRLAGIKPPTVKCAVYECQVKFETFDQRKKCCGNYHNTLYQKRKQDGVVIGEVECKLPECRKKFLNVSGRYHCSKFCYSLDHRRWGEKPGCKGSYYLNLLGKGPVCDVCGEHRVIDEHHVTFVKNKSDKSSKTVWLCPNHHMMIHRGYATYVGEKYTFIDQSIIQDLKRKQPEKVKEKLGIRT